MEISNASIPLSERMSESHINASILASDECIALFEVSTNAMSAANMMRLNESTLVQAFIPLMLHAGRSLRHNGQRVWEIDAWYAPECAALRGKWRNALKGHGVNLVNERDAS